MSAYVRVQTKELEAEKKGYSAVKHQAFVGTEYFDEVSTVISSGTSSTTAMDESTETAQFKEQTAVATPPIRRSEHEDRKSTRLNSSHANISYAVFCLKKKTS